MASVVVRGGRLVAQQGEFFVRVERLLGLLAAGVSPAEIAESYPFITGDDLAAIVEDDRALGQRHTNQTNQKLHAA